MFTNDEKEVLGFGMLLAVAFTMAWLRRFQLVLATRFRPVHRIAFWGGVIIVTPLSLILALLLSQRHPSMVADLVVLVSAYLWMVGWNLGWWMIWYAFRQWFDARKIRENPTLNAENEKI